MDRLSIRLDLELWGTNHCVTMTKFFFSGAELDFLVNEAASRAVRRVSVALQTGYGENTTSHKTYEASLAKFYEVSNNSKKVWKPSTS